MKGLDSTSFGELSHSLLLSKFKIGATQWCISLTRYWDCIIKRKFIPQPTDNTRGALKPSTFSYSFTEYEKNEISIDFLHSLPQQDCLHYKIRLLFSPFFIHSFCDWVSPADSKIPNIKERYEETGRKEEKDSGESPLHLGGKGATQDET